MAETVQTERTRKRNSAIGLLIGGLVVGAILYFLFFHKQCSKNQDCKVAGQICNVSKGTCEPAAGTTGAGNTEAALVVRLNQGIMQVGDKLNSKRASDEFHPKLSSPDQTARMHQQDDGNLVFYRNSTFAWAALPEGDPRLKDGVYDTIYQSDGELHTYDTAGKEIWSSKAWTTLTRTPGTGHRLVLATDGTLCSKDAAGKSLWCRPPTPAA